MTLKTVAVMSPGDMGEGVGASVRGQGIDVITVLKGRSDATRKRAERAGFREVPDLGTLGSPKPTWSWSIMPPERAEGFAAEVAEAAGDAASSTVFAEMNAISPMTSRRIAERMAAAGIPYIDGGIIGLAPFKGGSPTRLYVSGPQAGLMDALDGNGKQVMQVGDEIGRASAVEDGVRVDNEGHRHAVDRRVHDRRTARGAADSRTGMGLEPGGRAGAHGAAGACSSGGLRTLDRRDGGNRGDICRKRGHAALPQGGGRCLPGARRHAVCRRNPRNDGQKPDDAGVREGVRCPSSGAPETGNSRQAAGRIRGPVPAAPCLWPANRDPGGIPS